MPLAKKEEILASDAVLDDLPLRLLLFTTCRYTQESGVTIWSGVNVERVEDFCLEALC